MPEPVHVFFDHQVHREVVEAQRHPAPPHAFELAWLARRVGLTDRADAPRPVARRGVALGRDRDGLAVEAQFTGPRAHSREPDASSRMLSPWRRMCCGSAMGA